MRLSVGDIKHTMMLETKECFVDSVRENQANSSPTTFFALNFRRRLAYALRAMQTIREKDAAGIKEDFLYILKLRYLSARDWRAVETVKRPVVISSMRGTFDACLDRPM